MLHLVTGVPGAAKTAFVVTELDRTESANKVNLVKNLEIYNHNKPLMEKFQQDFTYRIYEVGSGHELKNQIDVLPDDYFDFLGQEYDDLRPDFYFQRTVHFNEIIERITQREGDQGFKFFLPVRTIYTNINALKIDYVRANVYDWRECPDGSIIVIDEVQLVEPYSDIKTKDNPIVQDLTVHRHRGFDFWFITQSPTLLHPTVKVLIGVHFHLTRPYGMTTVVYRFGSCKDTPNAMVNKQNCEAKFNFNPQQRIFKLYKSTTINTHKKRFPKGIWFFVAWVVLGIVFFIYTISSNDIDNSSLLGDGKKPQPTTTEIEPELVSKVQSNLPGSASASQAINAENLTKEQLEELMKLQEQQFKIQLESQRLEMIMQYEDLQKRLIAQDQEIKDFYRQLELYKTMLPKDHQIIKNNPDLQVRGVAKFGNQCKAYNAQGVLMTLNKDECDYYLQETGRVWKAGQTTDLSPPEPRLPPALVDNSTKTPIVPKNDPITAPTNPLPTAQMDMVE